MAQAASKTCEICVSAPGSQYCLDCEQFYCENCRSLHKRQKLSTNHQFQNASVRIPEGKSRCSQHKEELSLMCNTCNVLVCASCVTGKHNGHIFSKLIDVIAKLRTENETQMQDKTKEANRKVKKIEENLLSFDNTVGSVIKAITEQSNTIKRMVDTSVAAMIALVKEQTKKEKDKLIKMLFDANSVLVAGHNLDKQRKELDKTRQDETTVQQMKKLTEEINKLYLDSPPELPKIYFNRKCVTEEEIKQLIGTYSLSKCSPVEDKQKQKPGKLHICSKCRREVIQPLEDYYYNGQIKSHG